MARLAAAFSLTLLASLLASETAQAGGAVLPHTTAKSTAELDVRVAVSGGVRWSQITVANTRVMWLVPARPGAALDWASEGWLDALDEATNIRVLRPAGSPPCPMPAGPQAAKTWAAKGTPRMPNEAIIFDNEADVRAHAAARGFAVNSAAAAGISAAYTAGWKLISLEIDASTGITSSPTLRVSDDGSPSLPLALTGSDAVATKVNAFALATTPVSVGGARDLEANDVSWTVAGSSYELVRQNIVSQTSNPFLRESSSRAVLFDGVAVANSSTVPSVAATYFLKATGTSRGSCESAAKSASTRAGTVKRVCARGSLARVPGGTTCTSGAGDIDSAAFLCGDENDDLALALSEKSPSGVFVTRFAGLIPQKALGHDMPLVPNSGSRSNVVQASKYGACDTSAPPPPPPLSSEPAPDAPNGSGGGGYVDSDSCGGGSSSSTGTVVYYEDSSPPPDDSCGGSSSTASSGSTSDDSSSDDSSSDDDSEGWDSDDDDSSSSDSDGWDSDDDSDATSSSSSSSSSDGCGGSSSSSSSSSGDDGWDGMKPRSQSISAGKAPGATKATKKHVKKKHLKKKSKKKQGNLQPKPRPKSPVSRFAFLAVALILPIRRYLRRELPKLPKL